MATTTVSDLSSLFPLIYEDAVFAARDLNLMTNLVTNFNAAGYATRTVGIWNTAEVLQVDDGVDFTTNRKFSKSTKATFTPYMYHTQFIVTDAMVETDADRASVRNSAGLELGAAMAQYVDKALIAVFPSFSNSLGSASNALTYGIVAAALAQIRQNQARGQANCVLHPYQWHDVWVELGRPAATYQFVGDVANQAMRDYVVGSWLGMMWYQTANIEADASDDAIGAVFTRDALAMDTRKPLYFEDQRDASLAGTELNARIGFATGTLWAERGAYITSDVAEPTS